MFSCIKHLKGNFLFTVVYQCNVLILSLSLIFTPSAALAQSINLLNLPVPGAMVTPSPAFVPVLLKGMTIYPDDPLTFDFIIDSGNTDFATDQIKAESEKLVKYFLASMTVPKDDLWVNLSPYEQDRIIPEELGKTELGRDMLAQDYLLKQLTASLMYPEEELGKKFWDKIYKQAREQFGTTEIPVNTFNKVWILPEVATVYEHEQTVYIVDAHLKVMLDSDYEAMKHSQNVGDADLRPVQDDSSESSEQIIREIIIPALEQEVNEGKHFAPLRQIYHSLILAKWYKETIKNSLLSKVYVDQNKIVGVESDDPAIKDKIYARYMEAYKKGVFNYIKEDYDRLSQTMIPRKYFSGGEELTNIPLKVTKSTAIDGFEGNGLTARVALITPKKMGASSPVTKEKINKKFDKSLNDPNIGTLARNFQSSYQNLHSLVPFFAETTGLSESDIIKELNEDTYNVIAQLFEKISQLRRDGKIEPEKVNLRISIREEQKDPVTLKDGRNPRVLYWPLKGDPWQVGHLWMLLESIAKYKIDKVVIGIDNSDPDRKPGLSSLSIREAVTSMIIKHYLGDLVQYTTIAKEVPELFGADGEQMIFTLSSINSEQPMDLFYGAGSDHAHLYVLKKKVIDATDYLGVLNRFGDSELRASMEQGLIERGYLTPEGKAVVSKFASLSAQLREKGYLSEENIPTKENFTPYGMNGNPSDLILEDLREVDLDVEELRVFVYRALFEPDVPMKLVNHMLDGTAEYDGHYQLHPLNVIFSQRKGEEIKESLLAIYADGAAKILSEGNIGRMELLTITQPMDSSASDVRERGMYQKVPWASYQAINAFQMWGYQTEVVEEQQRANAATFGQLIERLIAKKEFVNNEAEDVLSEIQANLGILTGVGLDLLDKYVMRNIIAIIKMRNKEIVTKKSRKRLTSEETWLNKIRTMIFERAEEIVESALNDPLPLKREDLKMFGEMVEQGKIKVPRSIIEYINVKQEENPDITNEQLAEDANLPVDLIEIFQTARSSSPVEEPDHATRFEIWKNDQEAARAHRAGLEAALGVNFPKAKIDILLAATQFYEMFTFDREDGVEEFRAGIARRALVAHPDIAKLMLEYLDKQVNAAAKVRQYIIQNADETQQDILIRFFETVIMSIGSTTSNLFFRKRNDPVAVSFDGAKLYGKTDVRKIEFVRGHNYNEIIIIMDSIGGKYSKGGLRWHEADGLDEIAFINYKNGAQIMMGLAVPQNSKNPLYGLPFQGAKTGVFAETTDKEEKVEILKKYARHLVDAGLVPEYIPGPDVAMSSEDIKVIVNEIKNHYMRHLAKEAKELSNEGFDFNELNYTKYSQALQEIERRDRMGRVFLSDDYVKMMRKEMVKAIKNKTLDLVKLKFSKELSDKIELIIGAGATGLYVNHLELGITADGLVKGILTHLNRMDSEKAKKIKKVAGAGAGDVGLTTLLKLHRAGKIIIAVNDRDGLVSKPSGFTGEELQRLANIPVVRDRNVKKWMPEGEGVTHHDRDDLYNPDVVDADMIILAAGVRHILNDKTVKRLRGKNHPLVKNGEREPVVFEEGGNDSYAPGIEKELKRMGITAYRGEHSNGGGVVGSTAEDQILHKYTGEELMQGQLVQRGGEKKIVLLDVKEKVTVVDSVKIATPDGKEEDGTIELIDRIVTRRSKNIPLDTVVTIRTKPGPDRWVLKNQGDDMGYLAKTMTRTVEWGDYTVVLDKEGIVRISNHEDIKKGEKYDFYRYIDDVIEGVYRDTRRISEHLNVVISELYYFGILPRDGSIRIANAIHARKRKIFNKANNGDVATMNKIMARLKKEGYVLTNNVAKNIAAAEIAGKSPLSIEIGGVVVVFDPKTGMIQKEELGELIRSADSKAIKNTALKLYKKRYGPKSVSAQISSSPVVATPEFIITNAFTTLRNLGNLVVKQRTKSPIQEIDNKMSIVIVKFSIDDLKRLRAKNQDELGSAKVGDPNNTVKSLIYLVVDDKLIDMLLKKVGGKKLQGLDIRAAKLIGVSQLRLSRYLSRNSKAYKQYGLIKRKGSRSEISDSQLPASSPVQPVNLSEIISKMDGLRATLTKLRGEVNAAKQFLFTLPEGIHEEITEKENALKDLEDQVRELRPQDGDRIIELNNSIFVKGTKLNTLEDTESLRKELTDSKAEFDRLVKEEKSSSLVGMSSNERMALREGLMFEREVREILIRVEGQLKVLEGDHQKIVENSTLTTTTDVAQTMLMGTLDEEIRLLKSELRGKASSPISEDPDLGGIDMNQINVDRQGYGVDIQFDPIEIQGMIDRGIDGFAPVIINLTPLPSVLPLLGLEPKREEDFELSQLN